MALSRPGRREHIHSRDIRCRGFRREDGLWDIEATLEDTKTYSFANQDRGGIAAGEPIHRMHIRLTVSDELEVRGRRRRRRPGRSTFAARSRRSSRAWSACASAPAGGRRCCKRMGGVKGCTHLTELLLGPADDDGDADDGRRACPKPPPVPHPSHPHPPHISFGCHQGDPLLSVPVRWICSPIASIEAPASIRRRMSLRRMSCWTICGIMSSFSIRRQT